MMGFGAVGIIFGLGLLRLQDSMGQSAKAAGVLRNHRWYLHGHSDTDHHRCNGLYPCDDLRNSTTLQSL